MRLGLFLFFTFCVGLQSFARVQIQKENRITDHFITLNGLKVHYLDFGGEGMPLILIPSGTWAASVYKDFGPLLTENNRVIALTMPGYGQSEGETYDVPSQGDNLIGFLDAMEFDKAIFAGNSSATSEITYLSENYPDRVAGAVYLSGLSTPWAWEMVTSRDPHQTNKMYARSAYSEDPIEELNEDGSQTNSRKDKAEEILQARASYRPEHFIREFSIEVPALFFTNKDGRLGYEKDVAALLVAGSPLMDEVRKAFPPSPLRDDLDRRVYDKEYREQQFNIIQDSTARAFFFELAADTVMQREVLDFQIKTVYPTLIAAQNRMKEAFGDNLHLIKLNIPIVIDYAYRDSPELIIDPLKNFLVQLNED